jgi:hypothetical protein
MWSCAGARIWRTTSPARISSSTAAPRVVPAERCGAFNNISAFVSPIARLQRGRRRTVRYSGTDAERRPALKGSFLEYGLGIGGAGRLSFLLGLS